MDKKKYCKSPGCNIELTSETRYRNEGYCKVHGRKNRNQYNLKRQKANPEKHNENTRRYYKNHPEKFKEKQKHWREKNPDKLKKQSQRYCKKHPDKIKERRQRQYKKHPEKFIERSLKWQKENPIFRKKILDRNKSKRRDYGSDSINAPFEGSSFHHFIKEIGIYVPMELNPPGHSHEPKDFEKLRAVNKKILAWLQEKLIMNMLIIQDFTSRLEEKFGKDYFD